MLELIQYKNMRPSEGTESLDTLSQSLADRSVLSDYSGMQLVDVTRHLNNLEVDYQIGGIGSVVSYHIPAAGQPVPKNAPVFLYMDPDSYREEDMTVVPDVEDLAMEQAWRFITDAHLTPVTFMDAPPGTGAGGGGGDPVTYNPQNADGSDGNELAETAQYYVYRQFPVAGTHVQRGAEIKLKVRIR
jgi:hypothetical protein